MEAPEDTPTPILDMSLTVVVGGAMAAKGCAIEAFTALNNQAPTGPTTIITADKLGQYASIGGCMAYLEYTDASKSMIGGVAIAVPMPTADGMVAEVCHLCVEARHRRKGLSLKLLEQLSKYLASIRVKKVFFFYSEKVKTSLSVAPVMVWSISSGMDNMPSGMRPDTRMFASRPKMPEGYSVKAVSANNVDQAMALCERLSFYRPTPNHLLSLAKIGIVKLVLSRRAKGETRQPVGLYILTPLVAKSIEIRVTIGNVSLCIGDDRLKIIQTILNTELSRTYYTIYGHIIVGHNGNILPKALLELGCKLIPQGEFIQYHPNTLECEVKTTETIVENPYSVLYL